MITTTTRKVCRHCGADTWLKARRLCLECWSDPKIREQYPSRNLPRADTPPCRHCGQRRANRGRGLCCACSNDPAIRDLYPPASNAHRGLHARRGAAPPAPEATRALPGTAAKLAVLEERAAAGLTLWHPADPIIGRRIRWGVPVVHLPFRVDDE